jgi:sucrose phosphorylase
MAGAQGILPAEEIEFLVEQAREHGAFISYKSTENGDIPYEVNSTWYSALNFENNGEPKALQVQRAVQSMVGSRSDVRLALRTKVKRDVNRATLDASILELNLKEPGSKLNLLAAAMRRLMRTRVMHPAFHPNGGQQVLRCDKRVFSLVRTTKDGNERVLCLTNVSNGPVTVLIPLADTGAEWVYWFDLIGGRGFTATEGTLQITLPPYEYVWLTPSREIEMRIERTE